MILFVLFAAFQSSFIHEWHYARLQNPDTLLQVNEYVVRDCRDAWISQDKFLHFAVSTALSGFSYYCFISHDNTERKNARLSSLSLGACAGIAKELYDRNTSGCFSWKDLLWDGIGLAVGFFAFMR
jgi:uncharacterized protein YfiM (DUF2279 family)